MTPRFWAPSSPTSSAAAVLNLLEKTKERLNGLVCARALIKGTNQAVFDDRPQRDAAYLVKLWFDDHGVSYTAADLVAMTAMVVQREQSMRGVARQGTFATQLRSRRLD